MICVRRLAWPGTGAFAVPLILAGVLAGPTTAAAATPTACQAWSGVEPPGPGTRDNIFTGVAVISPCNAWAVGEAENDTSRLPLIEHWNGSAWKISAAQDPPGNTVELGGVRAISSTDIWAVGGFEADGHKTLTEHWNGSAWTIIPSPSPSTGLGNFDELGGVSGVSSDDVWAVGSGLANNQDLTEILHWDGNTWTQVPSPNPGLGDVLGAVVATSHTNAWAVGETFTSTGTQTLVLHWNGHTWARVGTPTSPNARSQLSSVTATSATDAWAVGSTSDGSSTSKNIVLHWNGSKWARVTSPSPAGIASLSGVTATSATNAWAVGTLLAPGASSSQAMILHWDGSNWTRVHAPSGPASLFGVGARSATNMWAVGISGDSTPELPLALHCC
jgi:hypothetical protein